MIERLDEKMIKYEIGQIIENFKNHQEGVQFDINDAGATMLVFFKHPTENEIDQFKSGKNFEIRFIELYGVIMITTKIGNLEWVDAPYSPHLGYKLNKFQIPNEGQGLALKLIFIDAITGEIKYMRLLGLSERFTRQLLGLILEQKNRKFDKTEYAKAVNKIYNTYTTRQIVQMSKDYCRLN